MTTTATQEPIMSDLSGMSDAELVEMDAQMMAEYQASNARALSDAHRAVKAELGGRAAVRARTASRSRAAGKAAATRAARKAAGLPPKRRGFTMDNAPVGGWTDADRVR